MHKVPDPTIGESNLRNYSFESAYSRGRIISETVGVATCKTIVDVGAFNGETSLWFEGLFPEATIWAIEPFPESYRKLVESAGPRTNCKNFAAASSDGSVDLFVNAIPHTNSLYPVNASSRDSIDASHGGRSGELVESVSISPKITVKSKRVDTFALEEGIKWIDLLKVDVQGAEVEVLRGSQGVLACTGAILIEVSLYDYYADSSSIGQIEELTSPHGFSLWSITDVSNNPMNGRTDCDLTPVF